MDIEKNKNEILKKIAAACLNSGKEVAEIQLLAVTKTRSLKEIENALEQGVTVIGENKVYLRQFECYQV